MANSISTTQSTVYSESKIFSDVEQPNELTILATKALPTNQNGSMNPSKKAITILHRLSFGSFGVDVKGSEILQTKKIIPVENDSNAEISVKSKKSRSNHKNLSLEDRFIKAYEEATSLQYNVEGRVKLALKALTLIEYYLAYIQLDGGSVDIPGRYVIDPNGKESSLASEKNAFEELNKEFLLFLGRKKMTYDLNSELLVMGSKGLTFRDALAQIKEFHEIKNAQDKKEKPFFVEITQGDKILASTRSINKCVVTPKGEKACTIELKKEEPFCADQLPDYEEVKSFFTVIMDYDMLLNKLMEFGWQVDSANDVLLNPQGKSYNFNNVADKWKKNMSQVIAIVGGDLSKLDLFYDLMKDQMLTKFIKDGWDKFGAKYNQEMNLFINGNVAFTVEEMGIRITLQDMGLF